MTVRRALLSLGLALAAGSAALAGSGLAVRPHAHAPGTPAAHDHLLAAYRYPLFLIRLGARTASATPGLSGVPGVPGVPGLPGVSGVSGVPGQRWSLDLPSAAAAAAALVFATLAAIVPRLPRPARLLVAVFVVPPLVPPVWRGRSIPAPPRAPALLPS